MNKKKSNKILVIIPARGNSKRLKNKNILPIKNLPMFVYVAKKIEKSKNNLRILVSSENTNILNLCKKNNIECIRRPKYLSKDETEKQDVIVHATKYLTKKEKFYPKIVVSLQANTPQVNHIDLDCSIKLFNSIFKKKKIKEVFAIDTNNIQNGAFRIMTYETVFQKTLSTKVGVYKTNYIDIHNKKEYLTVKKYLEKKY
jgi:CMP-N-acetylneuraminic acid synthetase